MSPRTEHRPETRTTNARVASATWRERRRARRQLEHDLASFQTPAQRQELAVLLAGATPEQAAEIERALARVAPREQTPHQLFDN